MPAALVNRKYSFAKMLCFWYKPFTEPKVKSSSMYPLGDFAYKQGPGPLIEQLLLGNDSPKITIGGKD